MRSGRGLGAHRARTRTEEGGQVGVWRGVLPRPASLGSGAARLEFARGSFPFVGSSSLASLGSQRFYNVVIRFLRGA